MTPVPVVTAVHPHAGHRRGTIMRANPPRPAPRLSIIIPSFNQARYLEQTLCSVLDQAHAHAVELLIIDGGSDDHTLPLLTTYDESIAYWTTQWDAGPAEAINHALTQARGEFVTILSADDVLQPTALLDLFKHMDAHPHADWLMCDGTRIDANDRVLGDHPAEVPRSLVALLEHDTAPLPLSCSVFRRALFTMLGPMQTTRLHAFAYEWSCRLVLHGILPRVLKKQLVMLREHAGSFSAQHILATGREYIEVAEHYLSNLELPDKRRVFKSCDERRRVYALAQAQAHEHNPDRYLWEQALRRPWWLANDNYRKQLLANQPTTQRTVPARLAA